MLSRNLYLVFLIFLLLLLGLFASGSIADINLLELKIQIEKVETLDYALSSELLQQKYESLIRMGEDYHNDLRTSVLESEVLNVDKGFQVPQLSVSEKLGYFIVNGIRTLFGKDFLDTKFDQQILTKMQYAFNLERSKYCQEANRLYTEIQGDLEDSGSEELAFVLLHRGYCLAVLGERKQARDLLEWVSRDFTASHFGRNARILLSVLEQSDKNSKLAKSATWEEIERWKKLYEFGLCDEILAGIHLQQGSAPPKYYYRARCLESRNQIPEAVPIYMRLAENKYNGEFAILANRRLLLLGHMYNAGSIVSEIADANAVRLGDQDALNEIQEAERVSSTPRWTKEFETDRPAKDDLGAFRSALQARQWSVQQSLSEFAIHPIAFLVVFSNGKQIRAKKIQNFDGNLSIESEYFELDMPYNVLEKIIVLPASAYARLIFEDKKALCTQIRKVEEDIECSTDSGKKMLKPEAKWTLER